VSRVVDNKPMIRFIILILQVLFKSVFQFTRKLPWNHS